MLKAAVVGCGGIAGVHSAIIAGHEQVQYLSCCDEKLSRAQAFSKSYGCKPFQNLRDLLRYEKPDVIHICTGHYSHVPLALYCLKNNVHVIVEKPAAASPGDLNMLLQFAPQAKAQLGVCFQNRYNAASQMARSLIESGRAGKVLGGRGLVTWSRSRAYYEDNDWRGAKNTEGGGVMINQAIHTLDLMQWLMGDPVLIEASVSNRSLKDVINVEDTAEACFTFDNGARGLFYATNAYTSDETIVLDIVCEHMKLRLEGADLIIRHQDGTVEKPEFEIQSKTFGKQYWGNGHEALLYDFYQCIAEGRRFGIDVYEGARSLQTIFKMYESSLQEQAVAYAG